MTYYDSWLIDGEATFTQKRINGFEPSPVDRDGVDYCGNTLSWYSTWNPQFCALLSH